MRHFAVFATMVLMWSVCDQTNGLELALSPKPSDFSHPKGYSESPTNYREDLVYRLPVGTISPGEAVDIKLNFPGALQLENYFTGRHFSLRASLSNTIGIPISSNRDLDTHLALLEKSSLIQEFTTDRGSLGSLIDPQSVVTTLVRQWIGTTLTPTSDFGRVGALNWAYTAPDWTSSDTELTFEFLVSIQTRGFDSSEFPDPQRDLITFVPEPAGLILGLVGFTFLGSRQRS